MGCVYLPKGRRTWMLKYYQDGRPIVESSGTTSESQARQLLKAREGDIAKGATVLPGARRWTFDQAARALVDDYDANARDSGDDLERRLRLHLRPHFGGGRRMTRIRTSDLRGYIKARLAEGAKNATINRELAALKRMFNLAIEDEKLQACPYFPMLAEKNARKGFFDRAALDAITPHLPAWLAPVMTFAFLTGWRVRSEVFVLTWGHVDDEGGGIRLDPDTAKNDDGRFFPFDVLPELAAVIEGQRAVRQALQREGRICPWVFNRDGERIAQWEHYAPWREACRAAHVPGRIPHDFRRTAVRNLVRAGTPERIAMQLTGHKTREVFDRYDIVNEADLRVAVARLHASLTSRAEPRASRRSRK